MGINILNLYTNIFYHGAFDTNSYHALFTLDHQAFVLVHSTDATYHIVVLVVGSRSAPSMAMVPLQRIRAVSLAGGLAHNLIDLYGCLITSAVVGFPQAAHVPAY